MSTVLAHASDSVSLSVHRRQIDSPLLLGLTLLASIVFAAAAVVYVRRQTSKLLRQCTCDVAASCCCCRQCIRRAAGRDADMSPNDIGLCRHCALSLARTRLSML